VAQPQPVDIDYRKRYGAFGTYPIGVIGAGYIVHDVQLPAYAHAGFPVVAIASRTPARAQAVADEFGVKRCYDDWRDLVCDPSVEILDLAYPPDRQLEIIRAAAGEAGHIRGILAQKPLGMDFAAAAEAVRLCDDAGIVLAVNQNMRFDQSIRTLKGMLDRGDMGTPVIAEIVMHVRLDWQPYAEDYPRKAMLIMSVHHLDTFRFLFGEPDRIIASVRPDIPPDKGGTDQMAMYILEYPDGMRAVAIDNCYSWADKGITWRVDGTRGIAQGTIGWPDHPWGSPSTFDFIGRDDADSRFSPRWGERWFPHGFVGSMGQLLQAVAEQREPEISGRDNLRTVALLEAAYLSAAQHRAVSPAEISG
jgi:predicted dehydrogenase